MKYLSAILCMFSVYGIAAAQDIAINNGRVIVGPGHTIENGSILWRNGLVVSVSANDQEAAVEIDAHGMTIMPGMINTHVHLITGPVPESYECGAVIENLDDTLGEFLQQGFTQSSRPATGFRTSLLSGTESTVVAFLAQDCQLWAPYFQPQNIPLQLEPISVTLFSKLTTRMLLVAKSRNSRRQASTG